MSNLLAPVALMAMTIWMHARGESFEDKVKFATFIREKAARENTTLSQAAVALWDGENKPLIVAALMLEDTDFEVRQCFTAWRQSFV